jgi:hypothetical protein
MVNAIRKKRLDKTQLSFILSYDIYTIVPLLIKISLSQSFISYV